MKKVEAFMEKVKVGNSRDVSRLYKYKDEIFELRDVHNCSFAQIRQFLLEQKIVISISSISIFYKLEKELLENIEKVVLEDKTEEKKVDTESVSGLDLVKNTWGKK